MSKFLVRGCCGFGEAKATCKSMAVKWPRLCDLIYWGLAWDISIMQSILIQFIRDIFNQKIHNTR